MVSAGERTPDYGHTPTILVNDQAEPGLPPGTRCFLTSATDETIKHTTPPQWKSLTAASRIRH